MYKTISKLKTFFGVAILIIYFLEVPLLLIHKYIFLLGLVFFTWTTIEKLFEYLRKIKTVSYFEIVTDCIFELIGLCFVTNRIILHSETIFNKKMLGFIIIQLFLLIILDILNFKRKQVSYE